jgi:hypothetical protein
MIIKELKFIGLLLFIIFAIVLLVFLVFFINYQRFKCSEYINHMKNIPISGKIEDILPYLQTGDIIITSNCFNENISKFKCFQDCRGNFVKKGYNYSHISMIYRKNNKVYLIDFIPSKRSCTKNYSLLNQNYENGLRIIYFNEYIKEYRENIRKKKYDCCQKFGIRFINRKINQDELNRRFENEFNILFDSKFISINKVKLIAASGWFLKDMQNNFQYSTEIFYPNDENDTFFCSEIIGALLQRIGVMKRINRSRMYYPADYNGSNDHNMFEKDMYSSIKIYE